MAHIEHKLAAIEAKLNTLLEGLRISERLTAIEIDLDRIIEAQIGGMTAEEQAAQVERLNAIAARLNDTADPMNP